MYSMIILTWKPTVIHINLFNHTFLFFIFWKGHIDWPIANFFGTLGTPQSKQFFGLPAAK
jgi:hypothetical protein